MKVLKIGIDIHGVIDVRPDIYGPLSHALILSGHEVHIMTGIEYCKEVEKQLENIYYTHYFSIVGHHKKLGTKIWYDNGLPFMDEPTWNKTKAEYAAEVGLDMIFDDSLRYGEYFKPETIYAQIRRV